MSILDGMLASTATAPASVSAVAKQADLDPAATEKAIMALAQAYASAGNTIQMVGANGGLSAGVLGAIASRLEGETALREIATVELAAKRTGMSSETLAKVYEKVGGDAALDVIATGLSSGLRSLGQGDFFKELLPFG
jgi:hypothetical protein